MMPKSIKLRTEIHKKTQEHVTQDQSKSESGSMLVPRPPLETFGYDFFEAIRRYLGDLGHHFGAQPGAKALSKSSILAPSRKQIEKLYVQEKILKHYWNVI